MVKIHSLSDVQSTKIGNNTVIWQYSVILSNAEIGSNCNINCHTFIENDVILGNNVTIKSGVYLWDGIRIEDDVFIGPNVTFVNDKFPKSKKYPSKFLSTLIKKGSSIGANATILGGIEIGEYALIGAGAVVTKDVNSYELVAGNPARVVGYVNDLGEKLKFKDHYYVDNSGNEYELINNKISKRILKTE
jgi:UDP-2-acetamido-3-amino-2,3-dideoxy-glucuronate N-acetyltransferase